MPEPALDARAVEALVAAAVAAPSIHNTQPWRFRLRADAPVLEVYAAPDRTLRLADPSGRALHLSVGAAVFNLRVAAAHLGWQPVVWLLPAGDPAAAAAASAPLACVRLDRPAPEERTAGGPGTGEEQPGDRLRDLYGAVWRRHSSRMPFSGRPVPEPVLAELVEAARREGARLQHPRPEEAARLLTLTNEAESRNTADRERREETWSWVTDGRSPSGIPESVLAPQDAQGRVPVRDFTGLRRGHWLPALRFETRPQLVLLTTRDDRPQDWLRAGQALQRVLLLLTARGLRASLLHQALEWDDLRWLLRDPLSGLGNPQMLLRIGYGPEGPPTPRRPVPEVLVESGTPGDGTPDEPVVSAAAPDGRAADAASAAGTPEKGSPSGAPTDGQPIGPSGPGQG